jgi:pentatricopeptide repeat protein
MMKVGNSARNKRDIMLRSLSAQGDYDKVDEIWDKLVKKRDASQEDVVPGLKRLKPANEKRNHRSILYAS